jgi:hypothetical protein
MQIIITKTTKTRVDIVDDISTETPIIHIEYTVKEELNTYMDNFMMGVDEFTDEEINQKIIDKFTEWKAYIEAQA